MEITVSQSLGELGAGESEPAIVDWQWRFVLPNLALWLGAAACLGVQLIVRRGHDWLIIFAVALSFILFRIEGATLMVGSLVALFIIVGLIRQRKFASSADTSE